MSTIVGTCARIWRMRLFSGSLKSRSPAWNICSRKFPSRCSKGALSRRIATSASPAVWITCPYRTAQVFDAPGARRPEMLAQVDIRQQAPVRADNAVEAVLATQQSRDDVLVEAEADHFVLRSDRHAVVGHELGSARGEGRLEGNQVVVEVVAGIDLLSAIREVRVLPVLLRPAAGKMLGHAGHALLAERLALETADIGRDHTRSQLRVLAEGAVVARPARLRGEVGHGMERHADADGQVFLPRDVAELLDQRGIAGGGEAQRPGALRERSRHEARRGIVAEGVARVGRDGDG